VHVLLIGAAPLGGRADIAYLSADRRRPAMSKADHRYRLLRSRQAQILAPADMPQAPLAI